MEQLVYFVVLVGVLVFIHELGHFAWAKFFGVCVLKFSLGFGPRLWGFRRGETEYVLSAVPIGGYVRMLGENPRDEVSPQQHDRSFASQATWRRVVIVVAGPAMNLLFPVLLYFVVFLGDTQLTPATVGTVLPNRPADGQLQPGDRITAIDGEELSTFYELTRIVERSPGVPLRLGVERGDEQLELELTPVSSTKEYPLDLSEQVGRLGIMPHHPLPVIGVSRLSGPAAAARLATFYVIVSAGGAPLERWIDLRAVLERNRGASIPVTYLRPVRVEGALGGLVELDIYEPRVATLTPDPGKGDPLERAGIEPADIYVSQVTAGSPEAKAGLLPGDRLLELDGRPIRLWATFEQDLRTAPDKPHYLKWRRGDREITRRFRLAHEGGETEHGQVVDRYIVQIRNWVPMRADRPVPNPRRVAYAVREAFEETWRVVELTVVSMVRLFQGRVTVKSIGGPLTIFEVAGTAAREGALNYLTLMAFISINLGLINLLPVPLLDGGYLMFFLLEGVMRRPLSLRAREYAHIAGLAFLVAVMVLAFKNDIERQWPQIVEHVQTSD